VSEVDSLDLIGFFSSGYDHGYVTTGFKKWSDFSNYWIKECIAQLQCHSAKMKKQQMLERLFAGQEQMIARTDDNVREMRQEIRSG
jgi:hypothetical protein